MVNTWHWQRGEIVKTVSVCSLVTHGNCSKYVLWPHCPRWTSTFFYLRMYRRHPLLKYLLLLFDAAEQQSNKLCRLKFCSATNKNALPSFNEIGKPIYLFIILITSLCWHFSGCPLIDQVGSWGHNSELVWWLMIWLSTNKFCCTSCILLIAALRSWDRRFSGCPLVSWWWSAMCVGV